MSKRRITVNILQSGQLRPYADTTTRGTIFIEWQGMVGFKDKDAPFIPWDTLSDEIVKNVYSHLVRSWKETGDWTEPKLKKFEKIGEATWEVLVSEAYTD